MIHIELFYSYTHTSASTVKCEQWICYVEHFFTMVHVLQPLEIVPRRAINSCLQVDVDINL